MNELFRFFPSAISLSSFGLLWLFASVDSSSSSSELSLAKTSSIS